MSIEVAISVQTRTSVQAIIRNIFLPLMHLYLIRHAESENNAKPESERIEDPPITELGHQQAQYLSRWVETLSPDVVITSPVRRALQTAHHILQRTRRHVHVWSDIFEEGGIYRGYGPTAKEGGPGLSRNDVISHLGCDPRHCSLDPDIGPTGWWNRTRESPAEAVARAEAVAQRLINTFGESEMQIAAITHADFKRKLLIHLAGPDLNPDMLGNLINTGVTKMVYANGRWQMAWFNAVTHLPVGMITRLER